MFDKRTTVILVSLIVFSVFYTSYYMDDADARLTGQQLVRMQQANDYKGSAPGDTFSGAILAQQSAGGRFSITSQALPFKKLLEDCSDGQLDCGVVPPP